MMDKLSDRKLLDVIGRALGGFMTLGVEGEFPVGHDQEFAGFRSVPLTISHDAELELSATYRAYKLPTSVAKDDGSSNTAACR